MGLSLLGIGLALLAFQFLKAYKVNKQEISGLLLGIYFFTSSIQNSVLAIGGFIFGLDPEKMYYVMLVDHILLGIVSTIATYVIFFILWPKISPWIATQTVFAFSLIVVKVTMITRPMPVISGYGIDWNFATSLSLLINILLFIAIAPVVIIFWKLFKHSNNFGTKALMVIISSVSLMGIINTALRFTIFYKNDPLMRTVIFDIGAGIMGILFILGTAFLPIINKWNIRESGSNESKDTP